MKALNEICVDVIVKLCIGFNTIETTPVIISRAFYWFSIVTNEPDEANKKYQNVIKFCRIRRPYDVEETNGNGILFSTSSRQIIFNARFELWIHGAHESNAAAAADIQGNNRENIFWFVLNGL